MCVALERQNPPFAERREEWGTLKFLGWVTWEGKPRRVDLKAEHSRK